MNFSDLKIVPQYASTLVCCFTGNRPHKLPWGRDETAAECVRIKEQISATIERLIQRGYTLFISGAAEGGDTYFAEAVIEARKRHAIALECAVPYRGQANGYPESERRRYEKILQAADYVTVLAEHYSVPCFARRNRYMVDKSSVLVVLDYGETGGTTATLAYARRRGLEIARIN